MPGSSGSNEPEVTVLSFFVGVIVVREYTLGEYGSTLGSLLEMMTLPVSSSEIFASSYSSLSYDCPEVMVGRMCLDWCRDCLVGVRASLVAVANDLGDIMDSLLPM